MPPTKYILVSVSDRLEIHECSLEDLEASAERLGTEGKTVLDIFDSRECAEKASQLDMYQPPGQPAS